MKIKRIALLIMLCCAILVPSKIIYAEESKAPDIIMGTEGPQKEKKDKTEFKTKAEMEAYAARKKLQQGDAYLPRQTLVKLELLEPMSSNKSSAKQTFHLKVTEEVLVNDVVVIAKGTDVEGTVVKAKGAGMFGSKGKLVVNIPYVTACNNMQIPVNGYVEGYGISNGINVGTLSEVIPYAGFFIKGTNIEYKTGQIFGVTVKNDTDLHVTPDKLKAVMMPESSSPVEGDKQSVSHVKQK